MAERATGHRTGEKSVRHTGGCTQTERSSEKLQDTVMVKTGGVGGVSRRGAGPRTGKETEKLREKKSNIIEEKN